MSADLWVMILAVLVLLVLSGFFSGSETALTGASRARIHQLEREGNRLAAMVARLIEKRERLIGALLLANNLVNVMATALATSLLVRLFSEAGVAYATIIMSTLIILFSEVMPKTYAINNADSWALRVAPLVRAVVFISRPLVAVITMFNQSVFRLLGMSTAMSMTSSAEELRGAIELHRGQDDTIQHERAMLRSILDLDDVEVAQIMTHRRKVIALDADQPVAALVDKILSSPNTRFPVFQGDSDNIVGIAHTKDVLRQVALYQGSMEEIDFLSLLAPPWFIPDSTTLLDQLQEFRRRREHFALVVDEYGAFMGIVTLEDILEEIVGDIADEHDMPVPGVTPQSDGSIVVDGTVTIRDLNREFEWDLPDEDAATIAGLVLHEAKRIPEPGQSFHFHGFRFDVLRRQRNQITRLRVSPLEGAEAGPSEEARG